VRHAMSPSTFRRSYAKIGTVRGHAPQDSRKTREGDPQDEREMPCGTHPEDHMNKLTPPSTPLDGPLTGVLIVGTDTVIGPFPDSETAQAWMGAPHRVSRDWIMIRLHAAAAVGNEETAHECGTVLAFSIGGKSPFDEAFPDAVQAIFNEMDKPTARGMQCIGNVFTGGMAREVKGLSANDQLRFWQGAYLCLMAHMRAALPRGIVPKLIESCSKLIEQAQDERDL
jgi:hypothetical protein